MIPWSKSVGDVDSDRQPRLKRDRDLLVIENQSRQADQPIERQKDSFTGPGRADPLKRSTKFPALGKGKGGREGNAATLAPRVDDIPRAMQMNQVRVHLFPVQR